MYAIYFCFDGMRMMFPADPVCLCCMHITVKSPSPPGKCCRGLLFQLQVTELIQEKKFRKAAGNTAAEEIKAPSATITADLDDI